jgi:class 3 adenylate cyclase/HAMP domain-containing protein
VLFVVLGVGLVTVIMALMTYQRGSRHLLAARQAQLLDLARAQASEVARRMEIVAGVARETATTLETIGFPDKPALIKFLENHVRKNPSIFGMALAFEPGAYRPGQKLFAPYVYRAKGAKRGLKSVELENQSYYYYPSQNWYVIPKLLKRPVWSEPYFDEGGGWVLMTTVSAPVIRGGRVVAIATADVHLGILGETVRSLVVARSGYAFVLTRQGTFLAAPEKKWVMRETIFSLAEEMKRPDLRRLGRRMIRGQSGVVRVTDWRTGSPGWLAYAPVKGLGWTFGVMAPESEVLAPIRNLAWEQSLLAVAGLLVMVVVVWLLVMGLTRPIERLTAGTRRLASGELSSRVTGIREGDEVGELAGAFNRMAEDLEGLVAEIKERNEELRNTLRKVELLESIKGHLSKFVPESVKRIIEDAPITPDLEKRAIDVSVLFLDIAGYTRLSEKFGSEEMNFLIERYFSAFLDEIHQNRGDINETAGDGLMIIFQDDEPDRHARNAVTTALAIKRSVKRINAELAGRFQPVEINIGINSGQASVGSSRFEGIMGTRWTFTATGPVTNVAARIGALAARGQILIGPETARRIGQKFHLRSLGPQSLKNVDAPVEVFEVLGEDGKE